MELICKNIIEIQKDILNSKKWMGETQKHI